MSPRHSCVCSTSVKPAPAETSSKWASIPATTASMMSLAAAGVSRYSAALSLHSSRREARRPSRVSAMAWVAVSPLLRLGEMSYAGVSAVPSQNAAWLRASSCRSADRDAVDVWRLLEAAQHTGLTAVDWPASVSSTDAQLVLCQQFGRPRAPGLRQVSTDPTTQTRVRALVAAVCG